MAGPGNLQAAGSFLPANQSAAQTLIVVAVLPAPQPTARRFDNREGRVDRLRRRQPGRSTDAVWAKLVLVISTRNHSKAVRQFAECYGIEKSAVSEHFVRVSRRKVRELLERNASQYRLCAIR